jgi:hypothetical protein
MKVSIDWKSWSFMALLLALALAIYLRPSGFNSSNSAAVFKLVEEKVAWKQELEKSYPFIVGEVPKVMWDYSDPDFSETVRCFEGFFFFLPLSIRSALFASHSPSLA